MNREESRKNAKQGWVMEKIDSIGNNIFSNLIYQLNSAAAELTMELDIFKEILMTKFNITKEQIKEAEEIILKRMEKDNEIIKKYKNMTDKTVEQRLELMKSEGISDRSYEKISALLKNIEEKNKEKPA